MKKVIFIFVIALGLGIGNVQADKKVHTTQSTNAQSNGTGMTVSSQDLDEEADSIQKANDNHLEKAADSIDNSTDSSPDVDLGPIGKLGHLNGNLAMMIPILAILLTFLTPLLIILIVFLYKYKNKRAKYRVAERALESGKDIPEGLFAATEKVKTHVTYTRTNTGKKVKNIEIISDPLREKGIKNICLGSGLFIFLWALTSSFGLGCIGLLIAFMGLGEYLIARDRKIRTENNLANRSEQSVDESPESTETESSESQQTVSPIDKKDTSTEQADPRNDGEAE